MAAAGVLGLSGGKVSASHLPALTSTSANKALPAFGRMFKGGRKLRQSAEDAVWAPMGQRARTGNAAAKMDSVVMVTISAATAVRGIMEPAISSAVPMVVGRARTTCAVETAMGSAGPPKRSALLAATGILAHANSHPFVAYIPNTIYHIPAMRTSGVAVLTGCAALVLTSAALAAQQQYMPPGVFCDEAGGAGADAPAPATDAPAPEQGAAPPPASDAPPPETSPPEAAPPVPVAVVPAPVPEASMVPASVPEVSIVPAPVSEVSTVPASAPEAAIPSPEAPPPVEAPQQSGLVAARGGACGPVAAASCPNQCCGVEGLCGLTSDHCLTGCQAEYGLCGAAAISQASQVTEATTSPTATPTGGGGRGLSLGAIIGIAVGLGSLLLITAAVLLCACRRRRLGYTSYNNNDPAQYATSSPAYVPQHQAYQYK
eukprot:CAMPEP_0206143908 /NCGR_PEP_ID=MMETSP1473-20131121/22335_1 /ASSEMBLY_ACC=CAM_ASM_001109 /TAXON_ID=1461547 /ORGANISM="Stichococcus sp, Strain RCC1054" /LENGTH=430 /DNA_ID=CAMNT_0053539535 /DNA_START=240 /DNA_END=1532 /DNA_ORIENTATION=+